MTSPAEELAYRSQRRYVFAVTLALVVIVPLVLIWFLG
jgi:hypothetical protein